MRSPLSGISGLYVRHPRDLKNYLEASHRKKRENSGMDDTVAAEEFVKFCNLFLVRSFALSLNIILYHI